MAGIETPPKGTHGSSKSAEKGAGEQRSVARVLEIISVCAKMPSGGKLTEIGQRVDMPKTSLHRLLRTLVKSNYLARDAKGIYMLGRESIQLGKLIVGAANADVPFPACARPVLEWLAEDTKETITLGVLSDDGNEMVFIDSILSKERLRYTLPIGARRVLFRSATGKAVLAFMSPDAQSDYVSRTQFGQLVGSAVRESDMPAMLRKIASQGYCYDRNGNVEGASAMASPIFDERGEPFAAISVAGPTERLDANEAEFAEKLKVAGERISRTLGYAGPYLNGGERTDDGVVRPNAPLAPAPRTR